MNSLKMAAQQKQTEEKVVNDKLKSRINFDSFKMTKPKDAKK